MQRSTLLLLGITGFVAAPTIADAQVSIRVPFVRVDVGPNGGVNVRAPFVHVQVPGSGPVYYPPGTLPSEVVPIPALPMPAPADGIPIPPPPAPAPGAPIVPPVMPPAQNGVYAVPTPGGGADVVLNKTLTHTEFAKSFTPAPGQYEVDLLHPNTGKPVRVQFTLPEGQPRVRIERKGIEFEYPRQTVEIRFVIFGKARVDYYR